MMQEVDFCDNIIVYNNGQDALNELGSLVREGKKLPSIIFLDLNMPIMDGWDFLEGFVKIPNHNQDHVSVYIISSSVDPRDIDRVKNYAIVNNYILKPITADDLKNVLAEVA